MSLWWFRLIPPLQLADYLSIGAHRSPHVADVNLDESFIEDEEEVEDKSILNRDDFAGPNHRTPRPLLETIDDATQSNEEEEEDEAMREDILGRPAARQNVFCPPAFVVRCSMTTAIVIDEAGPSSIVEEKGIVAPVESFEVLYPTNWTGSSTDCSYLERRWAGWDGRCHLARGVWRRFGRETHSIIVEITK